MNRLALIGLLGLCALVHVVKSDDGDHEIIAGDCDSALARDMIYKEHVIKTRLPPVSRHAISSWSGNATIYCLKVLNEYQTKSAICTVEDGGVGYDHVTIEMHSTAGEGLEFDIEVYVT